MEAEDVTHSDLLVSQAKQKGERKRVNQVFLIHKATIDIKQSETATVAFSTYLLKYTINVCFGSGAFRRENKGILFQFQVFISAYLKSPLHLTDL